MYSIDELTRILSIKLSKKRFTHSLNVAAEASKLSEHYGFSTPDTAYLAGLIHDCCKEIPADEQLSMVQRSRRNVTKAELLTAPLYHAIAGSWYAEHVFGITDEDILNAVRYHTVGRAGMSRLEEIIYIADLISADRSYKDVGKMRKFAYKDLDKAMLEALKFSVSDVVNKNSLLPVHTIEAYNQYTLMNKNQTEEQDG